MMGVVYLVSSSLGPESLRPFLASYRAHPAGAEHELIVLLNGEGTRLETLTEELRGIDYRVVALDQVVQDLAAYGETASRLNHDSLCCMNSNSVVMADNWLVPLVSALEQPDVGLVGATGSWESHGVWTRGAAWQWPYHLARLPWWRRDFASFPNPHVRTTSFAANRKSMLEMGLDRAHDKHCAYMLESGRNSITRQVQRRGLRAVVAGRDGAIYDVREWPMSGTFRSREQSNLLIADNRTRDWESASPHLRRRLARYAWGSAGL